MPDPLVLGFDTSAAHCAAALLSGDRIVVSRYEAMARGQAERLMVLLEEVLAEATVRWGDLARIGVGIGPGNFTGIRISVAAARGLSLGLGIPAHGVAVPEAMAFGTSGPVVAAIDARGGRIYIQSEGLVGLCTAEALPALPPGATCIGYEAERLAASCGGHVAPPAQPLADAIARIAALRPETGCARPVPLYLREADAAPARPGPTILAE